MDYQKEYYLSKSRFMAGLRCPKALYLNVHSPELLNDAHEISLSIINGNAIGAMACQLFPGVIVIIFAGMLIICRDKEKQKSINTNKKFN